MEHEIRETLFIGVSAILLASLLGFVSFLMIVRSDFAVVRNSEMASTTSMASYREFNMYNGVTLYGEDVVAAVRDYYDTDLKIRVNNPSGVVYSYDKYDSRTNPAKVTIPTLQSAFPSTNKYKAVLVYGSVDLNTITESYKPYSSMDTNVSSIVFFYTGVR